MLDLIQQRIIGVLFEKELTVPDSYPLTENALLSGCNQKSNRDPAMQLDATEIHPALLALREDGWVARVEGSTRSARYRHRALERLNVEHDEMVVLAELLIRGPQAPGALKARVARMGLQAEPPQILEILERLAAHLPTPLVERLARLPRERDHRFGHLVGPRPQTTDATEPAIAPATEPATEVEPARPPAPPAPARGDGGLETRVARLEDQVAELRQIIDGFRGC